MIKRFIVWYLKRHNVMFEYEGFVVRMFTQDYYNRLMVYANMMEPQNCRCYNKQIFEEQDGCNDEKSNRGNM